MSFGNHPERTAVRYPEAPAISIDYAVMERFGQNHGRDARAIRVPAAILAGMMLVRLRRSTHCIPPMTKATMCLPAARRRRPVLVDAARNLGGMTAKRLLR